MEAFEEQKVGSLGEMWLVSAPGEGGGDGVFQSLHHNVRNINGGYVFRFNLPELKVGTLDTLVALSEELTKHDTYIEGLLRKVVVSLLDVLDGERDKLKENLLVGGGTAGAYLSRFSWDAAKFPYKQPLRTISDSIAKSMSQVENELKMKTQSFNTLKSNILMIERKATGSLMTRSLMEIVNKDHFVTDSDYLITLIVVVPTASKKEWLFKYEDLTDMVVPGSSIMVTEDAEHCLFTVSLFKKVVSDFKNKCRENRFVVRDYEYNEGAMQEGRDEIIKLNSDKTKQEGPLMRWLKTNFCEVYMAWIHVKALRVFVESILRFGLPVNFQAMVVAPYKKSQRKVRELLSTQFKHLDTFNYDSKNQKLEEIPGFTSSEFFPYVYFKVNLEILDVTKM